MATQFANGKIVTDGLVLSLDAADRNSYVSGSLVWNDVSRNGYTGSLINGPTFDSANGGSIVFDGVDDYIQKSNYRPFNTSSMSYEIIFKPNSNPAQGPLGSSDAEGTTPYFYLDYGGGNIRTYNQSNGYFTVQSLALGKIYHFICTRNELTERNYVNSIESLGRTLSSAVGNNNGFDAIAGYAGLSFYLNCNLYVIRIYNKALSAQEVLQNYNAQKSRFGLK
jgi:hypothetical protein